MKVEQNGPILNINDTPSLMWLFGGLFMIVGAFFVYGASGGYNNYEEATRTTLVLHFIGGMTALAVGFGVIYFAPVTWITIDRRTETLEFRRRGISESIHRLYTFKEVKEFYLIEGNDSDGDPIWALGIAFNDGEKFKISAVESHDENFKRDIVFKANEFMYKQLPSYRAPSELS